MKVFTYGFLTDGSWQAHGVILFESTTHLGAFPEFRSGVIIYESMRKEISLPLFSRLRPAWWLAWGHAVRQTVSPAPLGQGFILDRIGFVFGVAGLGAAHQG